MQLFLLPNSWTKRTLMFYSWYAGSRVEKIDFVWIILFERSFNRGGDYMNPVPWNEIVSCLLGSQQCYKFFINYILRLHANCFIQARWDPSFVLLGSHFAGTKFSHVIASVYLSRVEKLINISVWKNPYKYLSINRSYFYCIFAMYMASFYEKKVNKCLDRISLFRENF